jgi:hypothetical protein
MTELRSIVFRLSVLDRPLKTIERIDLPVLVVPLLAPPDLSAAHSGPCILPL